MIAFASGVRAWLATGHTDKRKGFDTLAVLVQAVRTSWKSPAEMPRR
jgi:hypothetical protein